MDCSTQPIARLQILVPDAPEPGDIRLPQTSDTVALNGIDSPGETLVQRCGGAHSRGSDIRVSVYLMPTYNTGALNLVRHPLA